MEITTRIHTKSADFESLHRLLAEHGGDTVHGIGDEGEYVSVRECGSEIVLTEFLRNGWKRIMRFPRPQ